MKKLRNFKLLKITAACASIGWVFAIAPALAAELYFEPAYGQYYPGDTFIADVKINTAGQCINAVHGEIKFPQNILTAVDFGSGESILTLWVESPKIDQALGIISFTGGIPGEYCGRLPGDPGPSDLLGKIIFRIPGNVVADFKINTAKIEFLDTSAIVLSDGKGTLSQLSLKSFIATISDEPGDGDNPWKELLSGDKTPPEPFEIEIQQNPLVFGGKYFLIFAAIDKQTGIDYFEVKEGNGFWITAASPYLLKDQALKSRIIVRAIDKAGNKRTAEYLPLKEIKLLPYGLLISGAGILIIVIFIIIAIIQRKKNAHKTQ